jgi:hypothetical protein
MPIAAVDGGVTLAMVDPLDSFTRDAIAAALDRKVLQIVGVPVEFNAAFDRFYAEPADSDGAARLQWGRSTANRPRTTLRGSRIWPARLPSSV